MDWVHIAWTWCVGNLLVFDKTIADVPSLRLFRGTFCRTGQQKASRLAGPTLRIFVEVISPRK